MSLLKDVFKVTLDVIPFGDTAPVQIQFTKCKELLMVDIKDLYNIFLTYTFIEKGVVILAMLVTMQAAISLAVNLFKKCRR